MGQQVILVGVVTLTLLFLKQLLLHFSHLIFNALKVKWHLFLQSLMLKFLRKIFNPIPLVVITVFLNFLSFLLPYSQIFLTFLSSLLLFKLALLLAL